MKSTLALIVTMGLTSNLFAQYSLEVWPYDKPAVKQREVIPKRYTREASVRYHKRVHRIIDVREKKNLPMQWPKSSFAEVLYNAVMGPDPIPAYHSDSLDYGSTISRYQIIDKFSYIQDIELEDSFGYAYDTSIVISLETEDIKKFRIMEDWIFDHNYSDFRPHIIAIAPLFEQNVAGGISIGESSLFWVKMEDLRRTLVHREIFNPFNQAARLSYDDWFTMRLFSSYVIKESNFWNTDLKYYEEHEDNPMSALLEGEAIENNLFIVEHDLWEY